MDRPSPALSRRVSPPRQPAVLIVAVVVGATALYLARAVLVPIALAILLTFMVHPIVQRLTQWGLGRAVSVAAVVGVLVLSLGGVTWILAVEFQSLSTQMPVYRDNLIRKIGEARRLGRGGALDRLQSAATDVARELQNDTAAPAPPRDTPARVVVHSEPGGLWQLPSMVEALGGAGMVLALVIFMLIEREDLRNRLIRLGGYGRLATTTRALDETAQRISRYLLTQSIINASLGAAIAVGLLLLGVSFALLWGFLTATLRFIPYVGVWLAGLLLVVFSLAAYPTWHQALLVAGLFVLLELACSFALEPLLYGQSAGVSQVALLCSIAFWAWLWGPIGLLLATPLTVCLVVLAKHVAGMEFVGILMADIPPIAAPAAYYQRLLAMDRAEAARIVSEYAKDRPPEAVYDHLILPALTHARHDRRHGLVPETVERYVWTTTRELVAELHAGRRSAATGVEADSTARSAPGLRRVDVLGCPVHDEADLLGLEMLRHLVDPARWRIELCSPHLLASEVIALVEETRPAAVCIGALPASRGGTHTRYLCKRLRARFPDLPIIVGRWGLRDPAGPVRRLLEAAGANHVGLTLVETRGHLQQVYGLAPPVAAAAVRA
jgi:predicted PurR-regulated permease PerM